MTASNINLKLKLFDGLSRYLMTSGYINENKCLHLS